MDLKTIAEKHGIQFCDVVEAELKKLAETNPDFRYKTDRASDTLCSYNGPCVGSDTGQLLGPQCGGCIFGQALQNLGWNDQGEMASSSIISVLISEYAHVDVPDRWNGVQMKQDSGKKWSECLWSIR